MAVTERYEHSGSSGPTTLTADIAPATTTLSLADGTGFPTGAVGKFVVTLGRGTDNEERTLCTIRSGNSITVESRGWDGTVPRSHVAGTVVEHTWSATEADQASDHTSRGDGVHGIDGDVVGTTDTQTLSNKTLTAPVIADFTAAQHDHGDADDGGTIPALVDHLADTSTHGVGEVVGRTEAQTLTNKTLTTPVIADFTNAQHDHGDADDGGTLPVPTIFSGHTLTAQVVESGSPGPKQLAALVNLPAGTWLILASVRGYSTDGLTVRLEYALTPTGLGSIGGSANAQVPMQHALTGVHGGAHLSAIFTHNQGSVQGVQFTAEWLSGTGSATTASVGHLIAIRQGPYDPLFPRSI